MNIFEVNVGKVSLTKKDFVRNGGQADVYAKKNKAYKIYSDKNYIIPLSKIQELSAISNNDVIKPINILLDKNDNPIGYSMRFIDKNVVLCQLFTKIFKTQNGITTQNLCNLITDIKNKIQDVHKNKILIVDLNEMNILVQQTDYERSFLIDVDSYQTPSFPATALMENIRDRHSKDFNENTDWFSFAILSCYLLVGIHPYKGKHPDFVGNSATILDKRMKSDVSIFNKDTTIPVACSPIQDIPKSYREWYINVFENGKRCAPPDITTTTIVATPQYITIDADTDLVITELFKYNNEILKYQELNGYRFCVNKTGGFINDKREDNLKLLSEVAITPKFNRSIIATLENDKLKLYDAYFGKEIETDIYGQSMLSYDGRLYLKNNDSLYELEFMELPTKTLAAITLVGNILENATQIFDGVLFQNLLESTFCSIFPQKHQHIQLQLKELNGYTILNAKFENNILMVVGRKTNAQNFQTDRFIIYIQNEKYVYRKIENIQDTDINFVVLDNGICVNYVEEEKIELFHKTNVNGAIKRIRDNAIKDVRLYKNGIKVLFVQDKRVYLVETKKQGK